MKTHTVRPGLRKGAVRKAASAVGLTRDELLELACWCRQRLSH